MLINQCHRIQTKDTKKQNLIPIPNSNNKIELLVIGSKTSCSDTEEYEIIGYFTLNTNQYLFKAVSLSKEAKITIPSCNKESAKTVQKKEEPKTIPNKKESKTVISRRIQRRFRTRLIQRLIKIKIFKRYYKIR